MDNTDYKNSIASIIAGKIVYLAESQSKNHILDDVKMCGMSDKDGSVMMSFEWLGSIDQKPASDVLDFFKEIRSMLSECGKEIHEQIEPSFSELCGVKRIIYRFKAYPAFGIYHRSLGGVANK